MIPVWSYCTQHRKNLKKYLEIVRIEEEIRKKDFKFVGPWGYEVEVPKAGLLFEEFLAILITKSTHCRLF